MTLLLYYVFYETNHLYSEIQEINDEGFWGFGVFLPRGGVPT